MFVPTFLVFELLAAAAAWAYYASQPVKERDAFESPADRERVREKVKAEFVPGEVKLEPLESSDEADSTTTETAEEDTLGAIGRLARGVGMTGVEGSETGEEEDGLSDSASVSGRWAAEEDDGEEVVGGAVKDEFDDGATIGGVSALLQLFPLFAETDLFLGR